MRIVTIGSAYRRVLLGPGPLKVKLAALSRIPAPSAALLNEIIRSRKSSSKLKLLAADRLANLLRQREINKLLKKEST
jgi:hypothetical protein